MSRILFCAAGGHGHLQPLLPLAERLDDLGHEVAVAAAVALASHVTARGIRFFPTGPNLVTVRSPLQLYDIDDERDAIGRHFIGRLAPTRARDLITLIHRWPADLVVRDEADYGAAVAAEVLGLPHVTVVVQGAGGFVRRSDVEAPLEQVRAPFGLPPGTGVAGLHRYLTLNPFPADFRDPADPLPGRVLGYRLSAPLAGPNRDRVRVYVTLGTIFNTESGDLLARLVRAVAAVRAVDQVIVATGDHVDPAELGQLPAHVVIERFVAQREILAGCSAVISHCGSGTVLHALEHGLPQICIPLGADQSLNARRCAELGTGIVLRADTVTHHQLLQAVNDILTVAAYRRAAERLQDQIRQLPDLDTATAALEALC